MCVCECFRACEKFVCLHMCMYRMHKEDVCAYICVCASVCVVGMFVFLCCICVLAFVCDVCVCVVRNINGEVYVNIYHQQHVW